jgi:hypothetical protein
MLEGRELGAHAPLGQPVVVQKPGAVVVAEAPDGGAVVPLAVARSLPPAVAWAPSLAAAPRSFSLIVALLARRAPAR